MTQTEKTYTEFNWTIEEVLMIMVCNAEKKGEDVTAFVKKGCEMLSIEWTENIERFCNEYHENGMIVPKF